MWRRGGQQWTGGALASALALAVVASCGGELDAKVRCGVDDDAALCHCSAEERFQSSWRPVASCDQEFPCCFRDLDNGDCFCAWHIRSTDPNSTPPECRALPVWHARIIDSCPWGPFSASGAEPH